MTTKPDNISQSVWDAAEIIAKEATRDAMRDPLMPYYISVTPHIARALMAEREACSIIIDALAKNATDIAYVTALSDAREAIRNRI